MIIRGYAPADCKHLAELLYQTAHTINTKAYTKEQLNVWVAGNVDFEERKKSFSRHYTVVAVENNIIVGFIMEVLCMKNILIHGLGQNNQSWDNTSRYLKENGMDAICPNLFEITKNNSIEYKTMYDAFSNFCNSQKGKLNLCGISLGGILSLDFVKEYPEKVNSIILIGTPYKIPKTLFKIQGLLFHIMPKSTFEKIGSSKKEFITLVNSMSNLDIAGGLDTIKCKSLILCGMKDSVNMKSAEQLNKSIKDSNFKIIKDSSHEVNICLLYTSPSPRD